MLCISVQLNELSSLLEDQRNSESTFLQFMPPVSETVSFFYNVPRIYSFALLKAVMKMKTVVEQK